MFQTFYWIYMIILPLELCNIWWLNWSCLDVVFTLGSCNSIVSNLYRVILSLVQVLRPSTILWQWNELFHLSQNKNEMQWHTWEWPLSHIHDCIPLQYKTSTKRKSGLFIVLQEFEFTYINEIKRDASGVIPTCK